MTISYKAYVNGRGTFNAVAEDFQFPGGEWHLRNIWPFDTAPKPVVWIADVRGSDPNDLIKASLLAAHASQAGDSFVLMLPYLPAARADRGTPPAGAAYAGLVNAMRPGRVIAIDPHSLASRDWYPDLVPVPATAVIGRALMGRVYDAVIAPDKGALDRANAVAAQLGCKVARAEKERDFATGRITGMRILDATPSWGTRYLVVDDICDGGGTFVGLAQMLNLPKTQLDLWVTHGIFSGKAGQLHEHYGRIYTTDSHPGAYMGAVRPFSIVPTFPIMFDAMRNELVR